MDGTVAPWSVNPNFLGIYSSASNVTKQYEKFEIKSINGGGKKPQGILLVFPLFSTAIKADNKKQM